MCLIQDVRGYQLNVIRKMALNIKGLLWSGKRDPTEITNKLAFRVRAKD